MCQRSRSWTMAAVPTSTMRPRSTVGAQAAADLGAYLSADGRTDRDEDDGRPVEVGDEEEEQGGDGVDHGGQYVLDGVEALHRVVDEHAHQGEVDDPLGGGEVAAVDAGEGQADEQERAAVGAGRGSGVLAAALDGFADARLQDHQHERQGDQDGDDRLEGRGGQGEQQGRPAEPADRGADAQSEDAATLTGELLAVADGPADGAGDEPQGVGHGRGDRGQTGGEQDGEGDQGA